MGVRGGTSASATSNNNGHRQLFVFVEVDVGEVDGGRGAMGEEEEMCWWCEEWWKRCVSSTAWQST